MEKGSVMIIYKLAELIKKLLRRGTLLSCCPGASRSMVGSRTLVSGSHVSSMTSGCTSPMYYQGVVSLEKGSMIIRYANYLSLSKSVLGCEQGAKPCSPAAMFQA